MGVTKLGNNSKKVLIFRVGRFSPEKKNGLVALLDFRAGAISENLDNFAPEKSPFRLFRSLHTEAGHFLFHQMRPGNLTAVIYNMYI